MTLISSHPIAYTAHTIMFTPKYQKRVCCPVVRLLAGFQYTRKVDGAKVCVDLLQNNANVVRASWSEWFTFGRFTVAVVVL